MWVKSWNFMGTCTILADVYPINFVISTLGVVILQSKHDMFKKLAGHLFINFEPTLCPIQLKILESIQLIDRQLQQTRTVCTCPLALTFVDFHEFQLYCVFDSEIFIYWLTNMHCLCALKTLFFWLFLTLCKVIFSAWKCVCLQEFTFWSIFLLNSEIFVQIRQKIDEYKLMTATDTSMRCVFAKVNTHNFHIQC
jgi:hypothetical protein